MKLRDILANFASLASARVGLAALTFGLFWLLSHRLSTAQLGGFSLLMNAFFMVQTLPLLGMTMPLIRRVAARPAGTAAETSNSFWFALPVAALIGAALAMTGSWYAGEGLMWPFALLGLAMLPTAWTVVAECVLVGLEKMRGIAYVNLLEAAGRLLGAWAAIHWGCGLTGVFVVFAVLRCAAALGYACDRHLPLPRWSLVRAQTLRAQRREVPTYLSIAVVTALCARLDIVLLSKLLSLREAGIYAAAARLSDAALMVPTMAAVVIFPTQSRLFEFDRPAFVRMLERAVKWCLIGGFAVVLVVVAVSPPIIRFIYAAGLWPAAPILQILILGAAVMVVDQLLSTTMMAAHAQRIDLRSMILGLAVLVTLLVVLTHWYGLLGAAAAVPSALLVRVLYRLHWAQTQFASPFPTVAARVLLAAAAGGGVLFLCLGRMPPLDIVPAILVYAAVLWMTRSVRATDWHALRQLVAHRRGVGT